MIKTQKNCVDLLVYKPFDALKGHISKLQRSSTNIIIMLRYVKDCNSKLPPFMSVNYSLFLSCKNRGGKNGEEK